MIAPRKRKRRSTKTKRKKVIPLEPIPSSRLKLVFSILTFILISLLGRLAWLQLYKGSVLESKARDYQTKRIHPLGTRRPIVDRRGKLLAIDETQYRLYAHPSQFRFPGDVRGLIRTPDEVVEKLSPILSVPPSFLLKKIGNSSTGVKLVESLSPETAREIKAFRINGLDLEPYPQRFYPQKDLFANVLGFLDYDRNPQAGLELSRNKDLVSIEKSHTLRLGRDGTPLPAGLKAGSLVKDNSRLSLTLDARLQEVVLSALKFQVREWQAKKGVAIVMDVNNGEILSLASTPSYDPNFYWKYNSGLFKEWSVETLFEPGSTFKPINLALALEEGVISKEGSVMDSGVVNVGGWSLKNWNEKANGEITFAEVLQVSSNVGMVNIMQKMRASSYWEWLKKLGIDESPNTDLPGAISGQLKNKDVFTSQPIEPAVAAFGQGFSITPIKLVQLHALIANGGRIVSPHITKDFTNLIQAQDGGIQIDDSQIISSETTNIVLAWLESVVDKGSGRGAKIESYRIGGKTGTADKSEDGKSYSSKICSFVAILPVDNPRFVVAVVIDDPRKAYAYGSTVAVPVAKKIMETLIILEKIPPSEPFDVFQGVNTKTSRSFEE